MKTEIPFPANVELSVSGLLCMVQSSSRPNIKPCQAKLAKQPIPKLATTVIPWCVRGGLYCLTLPCSPVHRSVSYSICFRVFFCIRFRFRRKIWKQMWHHSVPYISASFSSLTYRHYLVTTTSFRTTINTPIIAEVTKSTTALPNSQLTHWIDALRTRLLQFF
jgi:hypothetical protein